MIIAFYPGGCGNRYLNFITNREYTTYNKTYDLNNRQDKKFRYLSDKTPIEFLTDQIILTHCLNVDKINQCFPNNCDIVVLKTDFKSSLRRQWVLDGQRLHDENNIPYSELDIYNSIRELDWPIIDNETDLSGLPPRYAARLEQSVQGHLYYSGSIFTEVTSAFETICFHKNYYETYPVLVNDNTKVIDVINADSEFTNVAKKEIGLYASDVFDFAWDVFEKHGPTAQIINLWEEYNGLKNFYE